MSTHDAAVLTFNFIPNSSTIYFKYTFASAEYPEYVDSEYNDVFAFFVNGTNYALLPTSATSTRAVAINNVNANTNSLYFTRYNHDGDLVPYGGQTVPLTFTAPVNAGVVNTLKIAIADTSDSALDSAVYIQAGTLSTTPPPVVTAVPTLTEWGLAILGALLLVSCGLILRQKPTVRGESN